jgi:hypothetical protein
MITYSTGNNDAWIAPVLLRRAPGYPMTSMTKAILATDFF